MGAPGEIVDIDLTGEIADRLHRSHLDGKDVILAYVDAEGRPHQSVRGSTHVHSRDQIAIWVRASYFGTMTPTKGPLEAGGFVKAIETNPQVSLIYRDAADRATFVFSGRARVESDPAVREEIYAALPPSEQHHSEDHSGTAVLIDVDHVVGGTLGQGGAMERVEMLRF